jgi:hypothetical protein
VPSDIEFVVSFLTSKGHPPERAKALAALSKDLRLDSRSLLPFGGQRGARNLWGPLDQILMQVPQSPGLAQGETSKSDPSLAELVRTLIPENRNCPNVCGNQFTVNGHATVDERVYIKGTRDQEQAMWDAFVVHCVALAHQQAHDVAAAKAAKLCLRNQNECKVAHYSFLSDWADKIVTSHFFPEITCTVRALRAEVWHCDRAI